MRPTDPNGRPNLLLCVLSALSALSAFCSPASAELRLPAVFGDHMVLQQQTRAPLWGWADPGENIEIETDWLDATIAVKTDATGRWRAAVPTPDASHEPRTIWIRAGDVEIDLADVLIGEVWVCSGQSNMEWPLRASDDADSEIAAADQPSIRLFQVANAVAAEPQDDCRGEWTACSPDTAAGFSAVGYFFGRHLLRQLDVPVGLIDATWGGTVAEAWTSAPGLRKLGDFDGQLDAIAAGEVDRMHQNQPTALYNAMIAPIQPFAIRGAIWYQGESNRERPMQYRRLMPGLIKDWRAKWDRGDFPFYMVQIAPFNYGNDTGEIARLREAQAMTLSLPSTGMAATCDIGNVGDIHPRNKQEVGRRLGLIAMAGAYGEDIEYAGPLFDRAERTGARMRIHFTHTTGGLMCNGPAPTEFQIAGADRVFHDATATIDGHSVLVSCRDVPDPVAVRFAFTATAEPNLYNGAGLPAGPFRTDDWDDGFEK